jgi:hypothetical protein
MMEGVEVTSYFSREYPNNHLEEFREASALINSAVTEF